MTKYHVEFDVESNEGWIHHTGEGCKVLPDGVGMDGYSVFVPKDALVEIVEPTIVAEPGWYKERGCDVEVVHWTEEQIEDYDSYSQFARDFVRMNEPTEYGQPVEPHYPDGYYRQDTGVLYRHENNLWSFRYGRSWEMSDISGPTGNYDPYNRLVRLTYLGPDEPVE